ncbi:MAG TPA: hypothetical protein VFE51_13750 [Verrucomicrobiae bacterium]|nr:hypothetical protein [Verrucomicrobiae bacterium]
MQTTLRESKKLQNGSILAYFMILVIIAGTIASVGAYVAQTTRLAQRRSNMAAANQFAIAGAVIACSDLNSAVTNGGSSTLGTRLTALSNPYTLSGSLGFSTQAVYLRTITSPFTNQTVSAQIWLPNVSSPSGGKIMTSATVGAVTQTATLNFSVGWGFPAAIISVNDGTTSTSVAKSAGQAGNVVINGDKSGPIVVYGGPGLAVLANGRVNLDTNYVNAPVSAYSMTNYSTANEVPDYTAQGTSNALFDINRFIAVANATPNGYSPSLNNHFTNLADFMTAANLHGTNAPMQGVVVVDIYTTDKNLNNLTDKNIPQGINIEGTMVFNFCGSGWDPVTEKIIVTADLNLNPADLSHLVATNPATYTTGYPPKYTDPTKNPANINIAPAYQNFSASDDLPAELYTYGCLDMHGNANICGVCYTPSYMEIENKVAGNTQYIRGACIMGNGIYYENTSSGSTSIISFDPTTVDSLATLGVAGKQVKVTYWQP